MATAIVGVFGASLSIAIWLLVHPSESAAQKPSQEQTAPRPATQQQSNSGGTNTQQTSSGNNSPNVSGTGNRVVIYNGPVYKGTAPKKNNAEPSSPPAPKDPGAFRDSDDLPREVAFSVGEHGYAYTFSTDRLRSETVEVLSFNGHPVIRVRLQDNAPVCDAALWDASGTRTIILRGNVLVSIPDGWERNMTDNALEVVNAAKEPVFQLIRVTKSHFVLKGYLVLGRSILVANDNMQTVPAGTPLTDMKIPRIFKYPAWKYPGQYEDEVKQQ